MKNDDTPRVAILVDTSTAWGRRLIAGITRYAREHGPWLIWLRDSGQDEKLRLPPGWVGDGIIARVASLAMARHVRAAGVPVVNISGVMLPGVDFPRVTHDAAEAGRLAAEYFLDRGFRHFAFVGDTTYTYVISRYEAFNQALRPSGCFAPHYQASTATRSHLRWAGDQDNLAQWLLGQPKPLAVFTWAMRQPGRIIEACRRVGLSIPEQVALLGGDDDPLLYEACSPPVSGVVVPSDQVGGKAAALLHDLMQGKDPPPATVLVKPTGVTTRQSTDVLAVTDDNVARALHFIRENANRSIRVEDVLFEVAISRSALERRFQHLLGRSVSAELQRVRLEKSQHLLLESDLPIPHVADASGFGSPEYMSYVFKRRTGLTPREYRKRGGK